MRNRILSALLLGALVAGVSGIACKKETAGTRAHLLVIFAGEGAVVVQNGKESPARIGMAVEESDRIRTTQGQVDLQSSGGATVRVRPFTEIQVRSLMPQQGVSLDLKNGSLAARVRRAGAGEDFTVRTPTAIAGVRGTTFTVEEDAEHGAQVTVLEGQVALAPRIAAADDANLSGASQQSVAQAQEQLQAQETVIEGGQSGSLSPQTVQALQQANEAVAESASNNQALPAQVMQQLNAPEQPVQVAQADITIRDRAEQESLVAVSNDAFQQALENAGSPQATEALQNDYNREREGALQRIESEARNTQANSDAEIRRLYRLVEVVSLKDGRKITGAVMTQIGDVIVVHSAAGVDRVKVNDISYIDYQDAR
ncbi:MAG: FecR domain-containing protein [Leptospirales bacterium]|nr:FecR domain-containing protein [Leptospirales bacterium]